MSFGDCNILANNLLKRSSNERVPVSLVKLQCMLYCVASEYYKATNTPLLDENFIVGKSYPKLGLVESHFKPYKSTYIKGFSLQDALHNSYMMDENNDPHLRVVLDLVWTGAKDVSDKLLISALTSKDSAWYMAKVQGSTVIGTTLIKEDTSYKKVLVLP